ncbi:MAG: AlpA family phage regulatory protein [Magnetospirillum sp.]|nr:AlpA family phage regulatory protein [Magnetospirillum sp.]
MSGRIISVKEVMKRVPYSRSRLWELERDGLFPRRVKLGHGRGGRVGYREDEIDHWLLSRGA